MFSVPFICLGRIEIGKWELSTLGDGKASSFSGGVASNMVNSLGIGMVSAFPINNIEIISNPQ